MEKISQNASGDRMTCLQSPFIISSAEAFPIRLNFGMGVSHSIITRNFTDNVIVKIVSDSGINGYGECIPRDYVTGETVGSVLSALSMMLKNLKGRKFDSQSSLMEFLLSQAESPEGSGNHSALCAMELAVLDLAGKIWKKTLSDLTGTVTKKTSLNYSLVVPLMKEKPLIKFLEKASAFDFRHAKIKVDDTDPAGQVRIAGNLLGNNVELRVDANCAWNRENAPVFMRELADLGVVSVEQPLAPDDLDGCAELKKARLMMITLDESVFSIGDVRKIALKDAADVINVRVSKCGGILESLRIIRESRKLGLKCQLGAHVGESCLLSSAGAFIASCTPDLLWLEGCFGNHLLDWGLCENPLQFGHQGNFDYSPGYGIGVEIDQNLLNKASLSFEIPD